MLHTSPCRPLVWPAQDATGTFCYDRKYLQGPKMFSLKISLWNTTESVHICRLPSPSVQTQVSTSISTFCIIPNSACIFLFIGCEPLAAPHSKWTSSSITLKWTSSSITLKWTSSSITLKWESGQITVTVGSQRQSQRMTLHLSIFISLPQCPVPCPSLVILPLAWFSSAGGVLSKLLPWKHQLDANHIWRLSCAWRGREEGWQMPNSEPGSQKPQSRQSAPVKRKQPRDVMPLIKNCA